MWRTDNLVRPDRQDCLSSTKAAQHPRWAQNFSECVARRVREAHRRRAVDQQLKQQTLFLAAVADLADLQLAAIVIGEQRVADAALRQRRLLCANDEEVLERAAA